MAAVATTFATGGVITQSVLTGNSFPYLFGDEQFIGTGGDVPCKIAASADELLVTEEVREGVAREHGLRDDATRREHREAAIGELLHLQILHFLRRSGEADRVEAEIARLATGATKHLVGADERNCLQEADPQEQLAHR
eukprot:CAMPEP_0115890128 /NCGR_PEP_ID=MMETSP0287-20121206/33189_1 /TAXON_ID=412157 /ORGANISM="Chrysochromulina rotalis, Strain UIO044" /LENGTH=138 /DNA_ID=CAMNT_0003346885 /DNA_START=430 /DNA_END=842 /DNA_ORIENTATION=-